MKRIITFALCLVMAMGVGLCSGLATVAQAAPPTLNVSAESALLLDANTGEWLFDKGANEKRFPASTTKIMTALLALEKGQLSDMVTCTRDVELTVATWIQLREGEIISLEELLWGLMLPSANDCAIAIAVHLGGSVEGFADMMNAKAAELGMKGSHFVNPNGLHDADHYSTAADLAVLTREAMKHEKFREVVATQSHVIPATNRSGARTVTNSNYLIIDSQSNAHQYYEYATGVKTGYTSPAQGCLVASAEYDGMSLIAVILKDIQSDKFATAAKMFKYGFENFKTIDLAETLERRPIVVDIPNASKDDLLGGAVKLEYRSTSTTYFTVRRDKVQELMDKLDAAVPTYQPGLDTLRAPLYVGQVVGKVEIRFDDITLTADLVCPRDVEENTSLFQPLRNYLSEKSDTLWPVSILSWVAFVLIVVLLAAAIWAGTVALLRARRRSARIRRVR